MRQGTEVYYLHGDYLGSTSLTTDAGGAVVAEGRYLPFGGSRWTSGSVVTDFGFTGQREESSLGLYDYNARMYSASLGRFISADSIVPDGTNPQAWNRYAYVLNNPLGYVDPSGHCSIAAGVNVTFLNTPCDFAGGGIIVDSTSTRSGSGISVSPADAQVFGIELSQGLKKLPVVGKMVEHLSDKYLQGILPVSSVRGVELVRDRETGNMEFFFFAGSSVDGDKELGADTHIAIYAGGVSNLDNVEDYAHSPGNISFANLADLQSYTRYDGTVARGPFGVTSKFAVGDNGAQVITFGLAFGLTGKVGVQNVRVLPVQDTIDDIDQWLGVSQGLGQAVWSFPWNDGSLLDMFNQYQNGSGTIELDR